MPDFRLYRGPISGGTVNIEGAFSQNLMAIDNQASCVVGRFCNDLAIG